MSDRCGCHLHVKCTPHTQHQNMLPKQQANLSGVGDALLAETWQATSGARGPPHGRMLGFEQNMQAEDVVSQVDNVRRSILWQANV